MRKAVVVVALAGPLAIGNLAQAQTWSCSERMTVDVDRSQRRVEMRMPVPPVFCDLLIVDGAKGPLDGHCPFVSGNPLVPYHQFAWFTDRKITWGYKAPGIGTAPQRQHDATYASFTLTLNADRRSGHLVGVTGGGDDASGSCTLASTSSHSMPETQHSGLRACPSALRKEHLPRAASTISEYASPKLRLKGRRNDGSRPRLR